MAETTPNVPTVGEIARRLGVSIHKIEYVIRARDIPSSARAGNARIFAEADVERIASELRHIERERESGHASR